MSPKKKFFLKKCITVQFIFTNKLHFDELQNANTPLTNVFLLNIREQLRESGKDCAVGKPSA